jgi:hypothetical protein
MCNTWMARRKAADCDSHEINFRMRRVWNGSLVEIEENLAPAIAPQSEQ